MSFLLKLLRPVLRWYSHRESVKSLADYNQNYVLQGLASKVEIIRDKWAVPHIYAKSESDLFYAQGFAHAQDRLWQMDLWRRIANGRLSELFGKKTLEADRVLRTLGFRRQGLLDIQQHKGQDVAAHAERYAQGVNDFISQCKNLPVEFKLLRTKPETWTAADSMAIGRFLAFQMSFGWLHQMERMQWVQAFGEEKASELFIEYPEENPFALPYGIETYRWEEGKLAAFDGLFLKPIGGSNNWAVAAHKMSDTQSAVLCNDPHLALSSPNIWIENHLICPDYECTGVSVPGVPFVLIGHNRKIAWGATLSFIDMQDLFIERFTSNECRQYEFGNEIRRATQLQETIKVKGQRQPHIENITYTHHGVIISDVLGQDKVKISIASPALKENEMVLGFYLLNKANDWNEFATAGSKIQAPSLSLAYADTSDNIGYYCTGKVPIRKTNKNGLPVPGFDAQHEWTGFIPATEMPHSFNPERGYIYTCNHKLVDDKYPYELGDLWMNGYRANRLGQLFQQQKQYTLTDFRAWQNDLVSTAAPQWVELYKNLLPHTQNLSNNIQTACALVANWDGIVSADSAAACIYHVVLQTLIDQLISEAASKDVADNFRGRGANPGLFKHSEFWSHDAGAIYRILTREKSAWRKDSSHTTLLRALTSACEWLQQELGQSPKDWHWGKVHTITFEHALGAQAPFDEWFNIKHIAIGGDKDTLNQQSFMPSHHYGGVMCGASFRQIINMGNFADSYSISPLGQSGNIKSPHHHDQLGDWVKGEYKPMLWTREQIQEYAAYRAFFSPR